MMFPEIGVKHCYKMIDQGFFYVTTRNFDLKESKNRRGLLSVPRPLLYMFMQSFFGEYSLGSDLKSENSDSQMRTKETEHNFINVRDPDANGVSCTRHIVKLHFFSACTQFFIKYCALTEWNDRIFISVQDENRRNGPVGQDIIKGLPIEPALEVLHRSLLFQKGEAPYVLPVEWIRSVLLPETFLTYQSGHKSQ